MGREKDGRDEALNEIKHGFAEIFLIGHSLLANVEFQGELLKIPWKIAIVDEFHQLKVSE